MAQGVGAALRECAHNLRQDTVFEARDYISEDVFTVGYCDRCALHVTVPVPSEEQVARYYPLRYYGSGQRFLAPVEWALNALYTYRALRFTNGQRPGTVLDIGCGRGLLLNKLRQRGWEVQGTELSEESSVYARDVLGLPMVAQPLESAGFPANHFDLVILWHVLEHVRAPRTFLIEVARVLKPGGVLVVGVPNFASWEARWGRDRWFHLDVPRHLTHFTPASLSGLLNAAGLSVTSSSFLAPEYDFFSFVQTAQNWLGLPSNLLYNLVRLRSARLLGDGTARPAATVWGRVSMLLTAPILGALSLLEVPVLSALGRGATVTMRAVRSR